MKLSFLTKNVNNFSLFNGILMKHSFFCCENRNEKATVTVTVSD